eukprot:jgi/Botrbrau1/12799/Bobra.117_1s0016.3
MADPEREVMQEEQPNQLLDFLLRWAPASYAHSRTRGEGSPARLRIPSRDDSAHEDPNVMTPEKEEVLNTTVMASPVGGLVTSARRRLSLDPCPSPGRLDPFALDTDEHETPAPDSFDKAEPAVHPTWQQRARAWTPVLALMVLLLAFVAACPLPQNSIRQLPILLRSGSAWLQQQPRALSTETGPVQAHSNTGAWLHSRIMRKHEDSSRQDFPSALFHSSSHAPDGQDPQASAPPPKEPRPIHRLVAPVQDTCTESAAHTSSFKKDDALSSKNTYLQVSNSLEQGAKGRLGLAAAQGQADDAEVKGSTPQQPFSPDTISFFQFAPWSNTFEDLFATVTRVGIPMWSFVQPHTLVAKVKEQVLPLARDPLRWVAPAGNAASHFQKWAQSEPIVARGLAAMHQAGRDATNWVAKASREGPNFWSLLQRAPMLQAMVTAGPKTAGGARQTKITWVSKTSNSNRSPSSGQGPVPHQTASEAEHGLALPPRAHKERTQLPAQLTHATGPSQGWKRLRPWLVQVSNSMGLVLRRGQAETLELLRQAYQSGKVTMSRKLKSFMSFRLLQSMWSSWASAACSYAPAILSSVLVHWLDFVSSLRDTCLWGAPFIATALQQGLVADRMLTMAATALIAALMCLLAVLYVSMRWMRLPKLSKEISQPPHSGIDKSSAPDDTAPVATAGDAPLEASCLVPDLSSASNTHVPSAKEAVSEKTGNVVAADTEAVESSIVRARVADKGSPPAGRQRGRKRAPSQAAGTKRVPQEVMLEEAERAAPRQRKTRAAPAREAPALQSAPAVPLRRSTRRASALADP